MSKLYLVPTPIGNLEDITLRALRVLNESAIILARIHVQAEFAETPWDKSTLWSHHKFNEHNTVDQIADRIASGQTVSFLISDAGTPAFPIRFFSFALVLNGE